ncbi:hypothetical protein [Flavobacterium sp. CF136]|uniref:hypothetical protein n=1 Tax=Flavobacterium sp. (strain CF136) TaxID=1144313 RepID=UPI0005506A3E|nr:hypothetical protein [Flavobacterium sp. CF136]
MKKVYLGIEFAEDYNKSFAEFKADFGSNHIFKKFQPKEREQELKKAYKIATGSTKSDGNVSGTIGKVKEVTTQPAEE